MIHKIRLQGFKALADVTISLGQINVFIGANGSGKSSILEAVGVLSAAVGGIVDDAALSRRGVRLGLPSLYKTSLAGQPARQPIILTVYGEGETQCQITLDNPVKQSEPDGRPEILEVATAWSWGSGSDMGITRQGQWSEKAPEITRQLLETLRAYRIYTPLTPVLRGVAPDPVPVPVLGLSGGGLAELLEGLLAQEKGMCLKSLLTELVDWV
ncbi:MAG: AAA family ATPase, partial [Chloroflexota bacterium]|nr:AAA family ATPase [Chloroflexota bacterium]